MSETVKMEWRKLETNEQGMWCTTEECWGIPTQYLNAGGVGSKYCSKCRDDIEAVEQLKLERGALYDAE